MCWVLVRGVQRYEYLWDADSGEYKNEFDKGCWHNFVDRFFPPKADADVRELMQIQAMRNAPSNVLAIDVAN